MGCFSGRLMSAASDQKLFCELCSVFNCSIDEFVGEKVVSPSYSCAILAPPPRYFKERPKKEKRKYIEKIIFLFSDVAIHFFNKYLLNGRDSSRCYRFSCS